MLGVSFLSDPCFSLTTLAFGFPLTNKSLVPSIGARVQTGARGPCGGPAFGSLWFPRFRFRFYFRFLNL